MMDIPNSALQQVKQNSDPLDNKFFEHAFKSLNALEKITEELYCPDMTSNIICVIERLYKGIIQSKMDKDPNFVIPFGDGRTVRDLKHNLPTMVGIIENNIRCKLFNYKDKESKYQMRCFLKGLSHEYNNARYDTYPTYEEFKKLVKMAKNQKEAIVNFLKPKQKEIDNISEYEEDEHNEHDGLF